jgi:hypothetical protein
VHCWNPEAYEKRRRPKALDAQCSEDIRGT